MSKKTFILASIILIIDQVLKSVMEIYIPLNTSKVIIKNIFSLTVVHNTGGAWSIFSNLNYIFIIISIIALIILIRFMFSFKNNMRNKVAFASLFGGIASNLSDRLFLGYVRDYIDIYIFNYDYPIFNIADVAIVVGVILLIYAIIKGEDKIDKVNK